MNVRIQTSLGFTAGFVYDGELLMNHYRLNLSMITVSNDHVEQNIALDRIKYFVNFQLAHGVFINAKNTEQCDRLTQAGVKIITLPEEPVDQIVGIMLFSKLNALVEDRLLIEEIAISSELGDNIVYLQNDQEEIGPFAEAGWWQESGTENCDYKYLDNNGIVALQYHKSWRELGLDWPDSGVDISDGDNKLVFADFQRDETK